MIARLESGERRTADTGRLCANMTRFGAGDRDLNIVFVRPKLGDAPTMSMSNGAWG